MRKEERSQQPHKGRIPYVFIDKERFESNETYWDLMHDDSLKSEGRLIAALEGMVAKEPDFFDPYISLYELYLEQRDTQSATDILNAGFQRAMERVTREGRFPDMLRWDDLQNRHIIRMIFNFATLLWTIGRTQEAMELFQKLLRSDPEDFIGARFAIAAIEEGYPSMYEFETQFRSKEGVDYERMLSWFKRHAPKRLEALGWWLEEMRAA